MVSGLRRFWGSVEGSTRVARRERRSARQDRRDCCGPARIGPLGSGCAAGCRRPGQPFVCGAAVRRPEESEPPNTTTVVTAVALDPGSRPPAAADSGGPPARALPEHCEVFGTLNERTGIDGQRRAIKFHLRLPTTWNGRFYFQGGGGLNGVVGNALGFIQAPRTFSSAGIGWPVSVRHLIRESQTRPVVRRRARTSGMLGATRPDLRSGALENLVGKSYEHCP